MYFLVILNLYPGIGNGDWHVPARNTYESTIEITFNVSGAIEVFCLGPVWNSVAWENVSRFVNVKGIKIL